MPKGGFMVDLRQLVTSGEPIIWVSWKSLPPTYQQGGKAYQDMINKMESLFKENDYQRIRHIPLVESVYVRVTPSVSYRMVGDYSVLTLPVRMEDEFVAYGQLSDEQSDMSEGLKLLSWDIGLSRNKDYLDEESLELLKDPDKVIEVMNVG